jgi:hypothetical protein
MKERQSMSKKLSTVFLITGIIVATASLGACSTQNITQQAFAEAIPTAQMQKEKQTTPTSEPTTPTPPPPTPTPTPEPELFPVNSGLILGNQTAASAYVAFSEVEEDFDEVTVPGNSGNAVNYPIPALSKELGSLCVEGAYLYQTGHGWHKTRAGIPITHSAYDVRCRKPGQWDDRILAPANATVFGIETTYLAGRWVRIEMNINGDTVEISIAHTQITDTYNLREGQTLERGQVYALTGNSGENSYGAHMHLKMRINGIVVNPALYLPISRVYL